MNEFLNFIKNAIGMFLILFVLFFFIIGVQMVPNDDMAPRMSPGDIVMYYRIDKLVTLQDVVVIRKNGTDYVSRVVAQEGDTVEITDEENLVVNGNTVVEKDIFYKTPRYEGYSEYPLTLGKDEFFVLSDKREGGEDSRYFGPVKRNEIKGTVVGLFRRASF